MENLFTKQKEKENNEEREKIGTEKGWECLLGIKMRVALCKRKWEWAQWGPNRFVLNQNGGPQVAFTPILVKQWKQSGTQIHE